jgi:deferrochelatase/peroxidase EfeB
MPPGPVPFSFTRNGTFLVVRKLHQQVDCFERTIAEQLPAFQAWLAQQKSASTTAAIGSSHHAEAYSLLRAKLLGRWDDGTPLVLAPTYADWQAFQMEHSRLIAAADADPAAREELLLFRRRFRDFSFEPSDRDGSRCPMTSHIRRSNPRDSDDPRLSDQPTLEERQLAGSVLVNRRRILRRGLPYGERWQRCEAADDPVEACQDDGKERGVVFMALCVGIFRQFEFIQQQWLNYGSDFNAGNDVCPIAGVQGPRQTNWSSKLVIGGAEDGSQPPFIVRPAEAVHCRGGAYFFVPSLAALRLMAQGLIDPI